MTEIETCFFLSQLINSILSVRISVTAIVILIIVVVIFLILVLYIFFLVLFLRQMKSRILKLVRPTY